MKWFKYILLVSFLSLVAQGPALARYIQADPIGLDGGWNRFVYVDADPLSDFDPDGLVRRFRDPLDLMPLEGNGGGVGGSGGMSGGLTSNAARREVMTRAGIPTSQQPVSQSRNSSGREYSYDVPSPGGGTRRMSVQQQTLDRSHINQHHWEGGQVKIDSSTGQVRYNNYGCPALTNSKFKVDY
ncbi:hypothetical protein AVKW3434_01070 [Acidovorax sp. SUPP3434]|uniref:RHS repeat-associated core domain-containing protein n=1 Tax=Acidovorax sp. SUPP3434 TaxID=2920880 RepID=UPI0023DE4724|nr:RHS repeat-associated core domain-containing protein [Acidovorax sp. SUPP3434]GKS97924.1 hypothetical protein AVKW3434_01070 [Acidovorax sp. SUPP3434]